MENIFEIKYNTKLDRLEIPKERWTVKLIKKIKKHKLISIVIGMFFILSTVNFYLVYSFMNILEKI